MRRLIARAIAAVDRGLARAAFLDLVAPLSCVACGRKETSPEIPLCVDCVARLPWWRRQDGCPRCGSKAIHRRKEFFEVSIGLSPDDEAPDAACPGCYSDGSPLHRCHTLVRYQGATRDWIPRFKYSRSPFGPALDARLAIEYLANEFAEGLSLRATRRPDLVIPVALHPSRRRQRGFNQSDAIARRIADRFSMNCSNDRLVRLRNTPPQAGQRLEARRANLRGAFRVETPLRSAECVWLVDDVLTTGATLESAAEALLDAGADEVHGVTLAATPPRSQIARTLHQRVYEKGSGASGDGRRDDDPRIMRPAKSDHLGVDIRLLTRVAHN